MGIPASTWRQTSLAVWLMAAALLCGLPCLADGASNQPPQYEPIRSLPQMSVIFGTDTRSRVGDTTTFPWSAVGQVISDYGMELHIGTGAMIGNKTVLTAAHVIYDPVLGWPNSITFIPALNDTEEPFGEATGVDQVVPDQWIQGNQDYDIGLIVLDKTVGQQTGFLQLAIEPDAFFSSQSLESAGYPGDLGNGNEMYSISGDSFGVDGKMILERITTEDGQSGSPVWFMSQGAPAVVGVIVGWQEITQPNGSILYQGLSTRIDEEFGTLINNTLAQHGDVTQSDLPAATSTTPVPTTPNNLLRCGAGAGQALLAVSLAWSLCFVSRRRGRCP